MASAKRRRPKPPEPAPPSPQESSEPPAPPPERPGTYNVVWALLAGLAIGFIAGRESNRGSAKTATAPSASAVPAKEKATGGYASMSEFPVGWIKDGDLLPSTTAFLADLSDAQKTLVMQALNERNCECGCGYGTLAVCLQKDPNCPRSPAMAKLAADMAKDGKSLAEILAAIDDKQGTKSKPAAAAPEAPKKPQYIAIAAWNPRKGPAAAKVTIVEFSDFQ